MRQTLISASRFYESSVSVESVDFFCRPVKSCHTLAQGLIHIDGQHASSRNGAHRTNALYGLAPLLIPMLVHHTPSVDQEREWFSRMLLKKGFMVPGMLIKPPPELPAVNDYYFVARYEMMLPRLRCKCMHLNCPSTGVIPVLTTLCAQCGVVNYCSSQCQKLAWNAERCPHKDICSVIARFRGKLGFARPLLSDSVDKGAVRLVDEGWRKWLVRTQVGHARVAMRDNGISPRTCRAIWLHIFFLNRAKGLIPLHWRIVWRGRVGKLGELFRTSYIEDYV
ncbi:MYND-type domain-containing protein [Mycena venus]|uniref:MYND-type domain-containing protein n=1 Tax=Mycena venus TaxID=2733690 RepID=A0A8H6XIP3_9AGAR|nr:MYND-type domain-containing protein [Mycena venus]